MAMSFLTDMSCLTLAVLNFWQCASYCSLKPLWSGMGEVVPARTSPTLHPPCPPTVHQLSWLALLRVKIWNLLFSTDKTCLMHIMSSKSSTKQVNSYSASHDNWCTGTLLNRRITTQWEGMGDIGSARYEPALLPPCPTIRVLSYSNCQKSEVNSQKILHFKG